MTDLISKRMADIANRANQSTTEHYRLCQRVLTSPRCLVENYGLAEAEIATNEAGRFVVVGLACHEGWTVERHEISAGEPL